MKFYVGSKESGGYFKNEIRKMFAKNGGFISLAEVKELFRENSNNEERNIVWDSNSSIEKKMRVRQCKDGWYLYLPEPNSKLWETRTTLTGEEMSKMEIKREEQPLPDIDVCVFETKIFEKLVEKTSNVCDAIYTITYKLDEGFEMVCQSLYANGGVFYRPCIVKAKKSGLKEERQDRKARFHRWADLSKGVQQVVGIVEFDDGHVEQVRPDRVVFEVMKDEND